MENNWKEKAEEIFKSEFNLGVEPADNELTLDWEYIWKATEKCMNLVFEATKKECADKAEMTGIAYGDSTAITDYAIDKESILNINKPNL